MHLFKSDGRYKWNQQGFVHILVFSWGRRSDTDLYISCLKTLEEIRGPHTENFTDVNGWPKRQWNEFYRCEQIKKERRRRIYLKNESDATLLLLKAQQ